MDITVVGFKDETGKIITAIHLTAYFSDRFGSDSTFLANAIRIKPCLKTEKFWSIRTMKLHPLATIHSATRRMEPRWQGRARAKKREIATQQDFGGFGQLTQVRWPANNPNRHKTTEAVI